MGIFYGQAGEFMWDTREALARPAVQAILVVVVAGLVASGCFRVAWLDDENERES
jgi:hypothetical protein